MDFPGEPGSMFRFGQQPAEVRKFGYELRASAAGRLRPADPCGIDFACGEPSCKLRPELLILNLEF